ncbi:hypothetical protein ACFLZX_06620 [Nanoarchaeota archaeon]
MDVNIKDSKNNLKDSTIEFYNKNNGNKVNKQNGKLNKGLYHAKVELQSGHIQKIHFKSLNISADELNLSLEDVDPSKITNKNFKKAFAIDPTQIDFDYANVTSTAVGNELYKCQEWNFSEQECHGTWVKIMDLVPGEEYNFTITPLDPGYGEINATNATHLDENYEFISNIFDEIEHKDDVWSEPIYENEIVRVTYQKNLSNGNIIDVFARNPSSTSTWYEIYKAGTTYPLLGKSHIFNSEGEWNLINVSNLSSPTDTFDFKIVNNDTSFGFLEFDYIHDAPKGTWTDSGLSCTPNPSLNGTSVDCTITYTCTGNPCVTAHTGFWLMDDNVNIDDATCVDTDFTCNGVTIAGTCAGPVEGDADCSAQYTSCALGTTMVVTYHYTACSGVEPYPSENHIVPRAPTAGGNFDLYTNTTSFYQNITGPPPLNTTDPANQTIELGEATTVRWNISGAGGSYYVERNGTLFDGPYNWSGPWEEIVVVPNSYFLGYWNYTLVYNETSGGSATSETTVNVVDTQFPNCSDAEGIEELGGATLRSINIDGDTSDWDVIKSNPYNYVTDTTLQTGDPDDVGSVDRDMRGFGYTYDDNYLYFYTERGITGNNQIAFIIYLDYDSDGYMNDTDQVVKFVWSGSNRNYDSELFNYIPANPSGDLMGGDGWTMNGSISINATLEQGVLGGSLDGLELETRVAWTDLGLSGPEPINFKASSGRGSAENLPAHLEDNIGDVLDSESTFIYLTPSEQRKPETNGSEIYYVFDIKNCGNLGTYVNLSYLSSEGWNVTLYYPYSNESVIIDSNNDTILDIYLGPGDYTTLIVKIEVPDNATIGTTDITNITASTQSQNSTSTIYTTVAAIAINPESYSVNGARDMLVSFNFTVYNYQQSNDTIDINATTTNNWNINITDENGTLLTDTNNNGFTDVGNLLSQESKDIIVTVAVPPGATINATENINITINSSDNTKTDLSYANITVKDRLILVPPSYSQTVTTGSRVISTYVSLSLSVKGSLFSSTKVVVQFCVNKCDKSIVSSKFQLLVILN